MSLLFKDCESSTQFDKKITIYAPKNKLDFDLYNCLISNKLLKHNNINISNKFQYGFDSLKEQYIINKINLFYFIHPCCTKCNLTIPIDMKYYYKKNDDNEEHESDDDEDHEYEQYRREDNINYCQICLIKTEEHYNRKTNATGLKNINDWIHIFSFEEENNIYDFYCNLNKNSNLYKQFGVNIKISLKGKEFFIINETTLEEIIKELMRYTESEEEREQIYKNDMKTLYSETYSSDSDGCYSSSYYSLKYALSNVDTRKYRK